MPTPYEKIYENLLPKFRSYEIPIMTEEEVKDYLHDFLIPAISRFHVCRKDLNDRDDIAECFNAELSDMEIEILSNYVLLEYIDSTYVRTPTLDKLLAMHKTYLAENETLLSRYAWMGVKKSGLSWSAGYKKSKIEV